MTRTAIITTLLATLLGCAKPDSPPESAVERQQVVQTDAETDADTSHPELEFFNSLTGKLEIELTAPAEQIGNLENVRATPDAEIVSLELTVEVFNRGSETFRELTPEELQSVAFRGSEITLRGEGGGSVSHQAPNKESFTVQDMLKAVADTERKTRAESEWFGGVDVHHVYFEGIHQGSDGVWEISWGS